MKKTGLFCIVLLLFHHAGLFAQGNEIDAYTLSTTELNGTARSMAMGGAFGALGGDLSVIGNNPAGLGIYRSSEVSGTLDLFMNNTTAKWGDVATDRNKTRFSPNNLAFSIYFPTSSRGVLNWSLGFSRNRLKEFTRTYKMHKGNGQDYSMADYAAWRASNAFGYGKGININDITLTDNNDPYENGNLSGNWLPVLGFESGMFEYSERNNHYRSAFGWETNGNWLIESPLSNTLVVNESGYMDEYNIGFGMNVSNVLFLGSSISVTNIDYKYSSFYEEYFKYDNSTNDNLYLENRLNTEGTAVSVNIGVITNLEMVRLGVAYNSPRWYSMTDYYGAWAGTLIHGYDKPKMENETPRDTYSEYRFSTPGKWIFSGALVLGQSALISADYEIMNYKDMLVSDRKGHTDYVTNDFIKEDYTWSHTAKVGTEIKITPQFAVRAGYMMQTSPMREGLYNNDVEVLPAGTVPHFTVTSKPTTYITGGLGYRFTPNFYMDLTCIYRYNDSDAYAFSNTYMNNGNVDVHSEAAKLKTKTTRVALTLGYKF